MCIGHMVHETLCVEHTMCIGHLVYKTLCIPPRVCYTLYGYIHRSSVLRVTVVGATPVLIVLV